VAALPVPPAWDEVQVMLHDDTPWVLVNRSVSDVRRIPDGLAEQLSQALIGEVGRVLEEQGAWVRIRLEADGYIGWTRKNALHYASAAAIAQFRADCNAVLVAELAQLTRAPFPAADPPAEAIMGKLPFGVSLPLMERQGDWAAVRLPDGQPGWTRVAGLLLQAERPRPDQAGIMFTLDLIRRFVGVPYLWGGRSPFGYDCSGLAQTFWGFMGVQIPRDADQQFCAGAPVESAQPGDLVFFGDAANDALGRPVRITHVAISLGGDEIIHANGGSWSTAYNSLDPNSPIYRADLRESFMGVRRMTSD
jgi:hypothetical protein